MRRVHISIDEREYRLAKKEARRLGVSFAEFARRAVRQALAPAVERPWMKFLGMVESGEPESSQSIDEIVYGNPD